VIGASVALAFFINLLLNASLSLLWTLLNSLQIIVHIPLINLNFPSNAMSVSLFFMAIANFDIIPHEDINGFIFDFEDFGVATPVRFQSLEFKTYNFVSNSGTTLWFIFIWIFASIFTLMISKCSNRLV